MKRKIITLTVGSVLCAASVFFSVGSVSSFGRYEKGGEKVASAEEFAQTLNSAPSSEYYNALASGESVSLPESFKSFTFDDISSSYVSTYHPAGIYTEQIKTSISRSMTVAYTEKAVYYDCSGVIFMENERSFTNGDASNSYYIRINKIDLDFNMYIGEKGVFVKFDKYEIYNKNIYRENGVEKEEELSEGELWQKKIVDSTLSCIRSNYGKWINFIYTPEISSVPDFSGETLTDDILDYMVKVGLVQVAETVRESFSKVNEMNADTLGVITKELGLIDDEKSNDRYDKKGNVYLMTQLGKAEFLTALGWNPSETEIEEGIDNSSYVKNSCFYVDLTAPSNPVLDLNLRYASSGIDNLSFGLKEKMEIYNINDTVAPDVSSSVDLYDVFGDTLKKLFREEWNA